MSDFLDTTASYLVHYAQMAAHDGFARIRPTWLETAVLPCFSFSKLVSAGLIREITFEND
jgi:hypothetical protein